MEHTSHDSLTVARRIGEAGMEQTQADAIAWAIRDIFKEEAAKLATKADLALLKGDIAKVEGTIAGLEGKIAGVEGKIAGVEGTIAGVEGTIAGLDAKIDTVKSELKDEISHLRSDLSWMPFRVCWWMLLTLATAAGLLLTAQQLWNSGLAQSLFG